MIHLITAIIKPHRLDTVKEALDDVGLCSMTVTEVKGHGRQGGHTETYRGAEYQVNFLPKLKVEVVLETDQVDRAIDAISAAARTGSIGDGKIWAVSLDRLVRIRTGEMGIDAV